MKKRTNIATIVAFAMTLASINSIGGNAAEKVAYATGSAKAYTRIQTVNYNYPGSGTDDDMGVAYAPASAGVITYNAATGASIKIEGKRYYNGTHTPQFDFTIPGNTTLSYAVYPNFNSNWVYIFGAKPTGKTEGSFTCKS